MVRLLSDDEAERLLSSPVPANLATLDDEGFPHITPVWFVWRDGAFWFTSVANKPHIRRLRRDPRAGVNVHVEGPEDADGRRLNRQVRAIGNAALSPDVGGAMTRQITLRYLHGLSAPAVAERRAADDRIVICLRPTEVVRVASF